MEGHVASGVGAWVDKLTEGLEVLDFCGHIRLCFREPAKTGFVGRESGVANENRFV